MRKVKHFAGYGTVSMGQIKDGSARLHVRVEGDHERGIHADETDTHLMWSWIVSRFVKDMTWEEWCRLRPVVTVDTDYRRDPVLGYVERCDYYFYY